MRSLPTSAVGGQPRSASTPWTRPVTTFRCIIMSANADVVEEIKWRKPSKPEGVATWVCDGNVRMADLLKSAVRLSYPKGARLDDPDALFNSQLPTHSSAVRAIDFFETRGSVTVRSGSSWTKPSQ